MTHWTRSTHCAGTANCVETAVIDDRVLVRDSKDPHGPRLTFDLAEWTAFVAGVKAGEFDWTTDPSGSAR